MNKLGFGFLRIPQKSTRKNEYDWDTLSRMVDLYMEAGGRQFDTYYTYLDGYSEEGIRRCVVSRKRREDFCLTEKLPDYLCRSKEDNETFFLEELKRCGTDYFDVLMLHWLNRKNYEIAERYDQFAFLQEKKAQGYAKRIGFSYHDSADLLDEILTKHPEVDVVLLQINYLDWDTAGIESGRCYETALRHGKSVFVMEPVKGGSLATLPEEAEEILRKVHPDWSPADWALRFVQSLPGVEVCLSGMNTIEQITANMKPFEPLTEEEVQPLFTVRDIIERNTKAACTGCRYCITHCPMHIAIPEYFRMYNELSRYPEDDWKIRPVYEDTARTHGRASACIFCHSCEAHCPQHLPIAALMKDAAEALEA